MMKVTRLVTHLSTHQQRDFLQSLMRSVLRLHLFISSFFNKTLIHALYPLQNNWINHEDWKATVIQTVFWLGNIIGGLLWGISNDRSVLLSILLS